MTRPFRIYGHRGAAAHHPENTPSSFAAALAAAADALETDVRMSRDGEMVVFHDADGARTCGVDRALIDCSWSEIRTWDAGDGQAPILLDELLQTWPDTFVNVDIKDDAVEAAIRTLSIVGRRRAVGLGSFHRRVARHLHAHFDGQIALVTHEVAAARLLPETVARWVVRGNAAQIPTSGRGLALDGERFVASLHRLGCRVDYWTIDDPATAARLVQRGADGIVTNDPAAIVAALAAARLR